MLRFRAYLPRFSALPAAGVAIAALIVVLASVPALGATVGTLFFEGPLAISAPNGVPIESFTNTAPTQTAASSSGAGAAHATSPGTLQITKSVDAASPNLFQAASNGTHIPSIRLVVGGRTLKFEDVMVSSFRTTASGRGPQTETITFTFMRMSDTANPPPTVRVLNAPAMIMTSPTPTAGPARTAPLPRP